MSAVLYETTNLITGKHYVGVASGRNMRRRGYIGSGSAIKASIRKYGKENFHRKDLAAFDTLAEAYEAEAIVVNEDWVKNPNTYNVKLGGKGKSLGQKSRNGQKNTPEQNEKIRQAHLGKPKGAMSAEHKQKLSQSHKRNMTPERREQLRRISALGVQARQAKR